MPMFSSHKHKHMPPLLLFAALISISLSIPTVSGVTIEISDAQGLVNFSNDVNSGSSFKGTTVLLASDIAFTGQLSDQFKPIGNSSEKSFSGTFDGQGYTISNLKVNSSSSLFVGLFGSSSGLTIRNVVIGSSCSFNSNYMAISQENINIGGIIGNCEPYGSPCITENSVNMGAISFEAYFDTTSSTCLGGIIGHTSFRSGEGGILIRNCANYGAIAYDNSGYDNGGYIQIGGISGYISGSDSSSQMKIQNCVNHGVLTYTGSSDELYIGGIAGISLYTTIKNCVAVGKILYSPSSYFILSIGNIAGFANTVNISNCFWTNDTGISVGVNDSLDVSIADSYQTTLNSTFMEILNSYTANNSWSKWILNSNNSTVTFKYNESGRGLALNNKLILLPDLAYDDNDNKTIYLWHRNNSGLFRPLAGYEIDEDVTLYWKRYEEEINYTLTFDFGNGTVISRPLGINEEITYPRNPKREGYTFIDWDSSLTLMPNHDLTIKALWKEDSESKSMSSDSKSSESMSSESELSKLMSSEPKVSESKSSESMSSAPAYVEIVFGVKDLTEKNVTDFIAKIAGEEFEIVEFETVDDEVRVIVRFVDKEQAEIFVRTAKSSSDKSFVRKIDLVVYQGSYSPLYFPLAYFILSLM